VFCFVNTSRILEKEKEFRLNTVFEIYICPLMGFVCLNGKFKGKDLLKQGISKPVNNLENKLISVSKRKFHSFVC